MGGTELAARARALYRSILRASRNWHSDEERQYMLKEGREQFERWRGLADPAEAAAKLEEGERRLEVALHYRIAYPRPYHMDQFAKTPYLQPPQRSPADSAVVPHSGDAGVDAKLQAAAARREHQRQERLAALRRQLEGEEEGGGS